MLGTIGFTNRSGGAIKTAEPGPPIFFDWSDAIDVGPQTCGHGTLVEFHVETIGGRQIAIAVRRRPKNFASGAWRKFKPASTARPMRHHRRPG